MTTAGGTCPTETSTSYDALGRPKLVTDTGGGSTSYSYSQNDVLVTVGPAPSGENTKRRQLEYDGLGRLTSVCEITSAAGSGTCGQTVSQTGYWTKYTYDALGNLLNVTQNAQSGSQQTRNYAYDAMSRLRSEANPESGTTTYVYDSDSTCGTHSGDLVKRYDAVGNTICFQYDGLHRVTNITYPSGSYASVTPPKTFVYDATSFSCPNGAHVTSRLAEAYTGPSTAKVTDLAYCYSTRGEVTDAYELTPNSSGYYHVTQSYWANRVPSQLSGVPGMPTISYSLDGEGRISKASAASGQNPLTGVTYNSASLPNQVNFGSGDSDSYSYDPNTLRMTQFKFNVGAQPQTFVGGLTWNANGTLGQLAITDPFNSADTQTCNYAYDDLVRITSANCGGAAAQTFSYDPFGNIDKSGSPSSYQPTYNEATNQVTSLPGGATGSYDANGNVVSDGVGSYSWDADGNPVGDNGRSLTFDAFDRMVEESVIFRGTYQFVYSPGGDKLAETQGQTLLRGLVRFPGGGAAYYSGTALDHYRHADWLGSSRVFSSPTQTVLSTLAYAPFGDTYADPSGSVDYLFTGQENGASPVNYDFLYREYEWQSGRWASPDPAGLAAIDPSNPQSWNRYAYVLNNPLNSTDPDGLDCLYGSQVDGAESLGNGVWVLRGDCASENDNGFYVEGYVNTASTNSSGDLSYTYDPADCAAPICTGEGTVTGFGNWDWPSPDETPDPTIVAISQELAPLNKLSDCTGAAVVHQLPLPNSWLDKPFNITPQPEDKTAASRGIETADKVNSGLEKVSDTKWPARAVWGLQKAGLPAASGAARSVANKIVPKVAPYASAIKGFGYALTAVSATYETVSCYNRQ